MSEKPKPTKPPKHPVDPNYGRMKPIQYPDTLGKRIGNKLASIFTFWMR